MDSVLATCQFNLANKQRQLAHKTNYQLPPSQDINLGEKQQIDEAEELYKLTQDLKNGIETRVPLSDPIAQIQQKKIQVLIAERQYSLAERQIRIIQGHIITGMDASASKSVLGRHLDLRVTEELQKEAQPLLSEAADLLKKGRHSVTFAELGARQRMMQRIHGQGQQDEPEVSEPWRDQMDAYRPPVPPKPSTPEPVPASPAPNSDAAPYSPPPVSEPLQTSQSSPPPPYGTAQDHYYQTQIQLSGKKKGGNRGCIIGLLVCLVLAGIIGGGVYALIHFNVIKI